MGFIYKQMNSTYILTHWRRVKHISVSNLTIIGSDYLNQCCNGVNWTPGSKLQWNLDCNIYILIRENAFQNVVWKTAAILSLPQCVNSLWPSHALRGLRTLGKHWINNCVLPFVGIKPSCSVLFHYQLRPQISVKAEVVFNNFDWNFFKCCMIMIILFYPHCVDPVMMQGCHDSFGRH